MTDYCKNALTISHDDPKVITRVIMAYQREKLFDQFIPCPKEFLRYGSPMTNKTIARRLTIKYGAECLLTWRILNWGTTQDSGRAEGNTLKKISSKRIKMNILTCDPPVHVLDYWADLGCDVRGSFLEEGERRWTMYKNKQIFVWIEEKKERVQIERAKITAEIERISKDDPIVLSMIKPIYRLRNGSCDTTAIQRQAA